MKHLKLFEGFQDEIDEFIVKSVHDEGPDCIDYFPDSITVNGKNYKAKVASDGGNDGTYLTLFTGEALNEGRVKEFFGSLLKNEETLSLAFDLATKAKAGNENSKECEDQLKRLLKN